MGGPRWMVPPCAAGMYWPDLAPPLSCGATSVACRGMDAIGFLFGSVVYFGFIAGLVTVAVWHVDEKNAVPWASPWRMRSAKLSAIGGPVPC